MCACWKYDASSLSPLLLEPLRLDLFSSLLIFIPDIAKDFFIFFCSLDVLLVLLVLLELLEQDLLSSFLLLDVLSCGAGSAPYLSSTFCHMGRQHHPLPHYPFEQTLHLMRSSCWSQQQICCTCPADGGSTVGSLDIHRRLW